MENQDLRARHMCLSVCVRLFEFHTNLYLYILFQCILAIVDDGTIHFVVHFASVTQYVYIYTP